MACADQFAFMVTPYSFKPEYKEGEESSDSSAGECSDGSGEELVGRLVTLDWCKYSYCTASTLNHPRECVCCREVAETSTLADLLNSEPISCIVQHDDFRAFCLTRAVLKTSLARIKHLVQGMDFSAAELPNEYEKAHIK